MHMLEVEREPDRVGRRRRVLGQRQRLPQRAGALDGAAAAAAVARRRRRRCARRRGGGGRRRVVLLLLLLAARDLLAERALLLGDLAIARRLDAVGANERKVARAELASRGREEKRDGKKSERAP